MIVESAEVTLLQLELATQLCGWPALAAAPGKSDEVLEAALAQIAARETPAPAIVDSELVRKLEEFARERAAREDAGG